MFVRTKRLVRRFRHCYTRIKASLFYLYCSSWGSTVDGTGVSARFSSRFQFLLPLSLFHSLPLSFPPFLSAVKWPSNPAGGSGERCNSPSGVRSADPAAKDFGIFWAKKTRLMATIWFFLSDQKWRSAPDWTYVRNNLFFRISPIPMTW